jgi:hypothetical protein
MSSAASSWRRSLVMASGACTSTRCDHGVVDRAGGDAQAGAAQRRDGRPVEQKVPDADTKQPAVRGPPREHGGSVVRPNHEPSGQPVRDGLLRPS